MIENGTGAASGAVANKKTNRVKTLPKVAVQQKAVVPPISIYKLGIDIGGVFTDFVLLNTENGNLYFGKTLTTYPDPIEGILEGTRLLLETHKVLPSHIRTVVHGTTLITNAIIERKGAKTGLITTQGFEDVLEIGREMQYDLDDISIAVPKPLVPRNLRFGVSERLDKDGTILEPLNINELASVVQALVAQKVTSIGVCLLHAFANPTHEQKIGEFLKRRFPDIYFSLSSEVMPEIRAYESTSTTVMNAYIQPIADKYWSVLEKKLENIGFKGIINSMFSSGRLTTLDEARKVPIQLLESGHAGGTMASVFVCKMLKKAPLLAFDMGGTTAKASLICNGAPEITHRFEAAREKRFKKGSGLPVRIPMIDRIEMGEGGGSMARIDALGLLVVGSEKAASQSIPACYGRGDTEPTVTDADLVLGFLNENYFLGGSISLHKDLAIKALDEKIAKPLGISVVEAAWEIHRIVNENMASAARVSILERGLDPSTFSMMAFGGAGPVHAFQTARLLCVPQLIIPVGAGVASALGFLVSPVAAESITSYVRRVSELDWAKVNLFLRQAEQKGYDFLKKAGISAAQATIQRFVEMRYVGQGQEITVALPNDVTLIPDRVAAIERHFDAAYAVRYGRLMQGVEREIVTWRVLVSGPTPILPLKQVANQAQIRHSTENRALKGHRPVYLGTCFVECPVYDRYSLRAGERFSSPAIIEEAESTLVIGEKATIHLDSFGNIIVDLHY